MITAIVQFKMPEPLTRDKAQTLFLDSAPKHRQVQGLIRKYYLLSKDGATAGGVYLFNSREDASAPMSGRNTLWINIVGRGTVLVHNLYAGFARFRTR